MILSSRDRILRTQGIGKLRRRKVFLSEMYFARDMPSDQSAISRKRSKSSEPLSSSIEMVSQKEDDNVSTS